MLFFVTKAATFLVSSRVVDAFDINACKKIIQCKKQMSFPDTKKAVVSITLVIQMELEIGGEENTLI